MREEKPDSFKPENYKDLKILTSRDILLAELDSVKVETVKTLEDLQQAEFIWEPLQGKQRTTDTSLPSEQKKVWRVFKNEGRWTYDYAPGEIMPVPFTTIQWIMNHVAQTGMMYLHCIKTGGKEGGVLSWEDLPVYSSLEQLRDYCYEMLEENRKYLSSIEDKNVTDFLNSFTPAPWGEMRPTWLNIWGGVIEHTLQHTMQIAARKEYFRLGLNKFS